MNTERRAAPGHRVRRGPCTEPTDRPDRCTAASPHAPVAVHGPSRKKSRLAAATRAELPDAVRGSHDAQRPWGTAELSSAPATAVPRGGLSFCIQITVPAGVHRGSPGACMSCMLRNVEIVVLSDPIRFFSNSCFLSKRCNVDLLSPQIA